MLSTNVTVAKFALLSMLSLSGIQTDQNVMTMDDSDAASIVSNLVSPESQKVFSNLLPNSSPERLNDDEAASLKSIIREATYNLSSCSKPWE